MKRAMKRSMTMLAVVSLVGCVRAPSMVYMVDEKTAIEQQASGDFRALENELDQAALSPKAEPFTSTQVETDGGRVAGVDSVAQLYNEVRGESEVIDGLLVRRCIGEAKDGLLQETPTSCAGAVQPNEVSGAIQRANRNRRQIWAWIMSTRPGAGEDEVRRIWRENHLKRVVCGGQVQQPDGAWGVKGC